jgi:hypothetical protein
MLTISSTDLLTFKQTFLNNSIFSCDLWLELPGNYVDNNTLERFLSVLSDDGTTIEFTDKIRIFICFENYGIKLCRMEDKEPKSSGFNYNRPFCGLVYQQLETQHRLLDFGNIVGLSSLTINYKVRLPDGVTPVFMLGQTNEDIMNNSINCKCDIYYGEIVPTDKHPLIALTDEEQNIVSNTNDDNLVIQQLFFIIIILLSILDKYHDIADRIENPYKDRMRKQVRDRYTELCDHFFDRYDSNRDNNYYRLIHIFFEKINPYITESKGKQTNIT